jgi:hypothetical protein
MPGLDGSKHFDTDVDTARCLTEGFEVGNTHDLAVQDDPDGTVSPARWNAIVVFVHMSGAERGRNNAIYLERAG